MASDQPLSFMTKLSDVVYYHKPTATTSTPASHSQTAAPRLLLLATWMGAQEAHISKYVRPYQALFPSSPILLLRFETRHLLPTLPWRRRAYVAEYAAAVPILQSVAEDLQTSPISSDNNNLKESPEILIHIWSNGGSIALSTVYNLYKKATTVPFPRHAIVFDSTPGFFRYKPSVLVMTQGIKSALVRLLMSPISHLLSAWYWFLHIFLARWIPALQGVVEAAAERHNDLSPEFGGRALTEVRRSYIYGPGDDVICEKHVEGHAEDANQKGLDQVRLERFIGTKHVQHVRGNEERYWTVVEETWEGVGFESADEEQVLN